MKKNKTLILVLVLLVAVAAYYYFSRSSGTNKAGEFKDFAIEDTMSINKVFIVDPRGKNVTLNRTEQGWLVNNQYDARPDNTRLIMKTFNQIAIKTPVPKSSVANVIKNLATNAIKVEIYQGEEKPSKVYYIGNSTMDQQGTYMLLEKNGEKSSVPFVTHIPGFHGFLSSRFFTEEKLWRDGTVFRYTPDQIKKIEVNYYETPEQSFAINKKGNQYTIANLSNGKNLPDIDTTRVKEYIDRYGQIYFEMIDVESTEVYKDSVIASQPYFSISLTDIKGREQKIVSYHMPNFRGLKDPQGDEFKYDVDRMYGYLNEADFTYIQFPTFDKLTVSLNDFRK